MLQLEKIRNDDMFRTECLQYREKEGRIQKKVGRAYGRNEGEKMNEDEKRSGGQDKTREWISCEVIYSPTP